MGVTFIELPLVVEDVLDRLTDIVVQFMHELMLSVVLLDSLLHATERAVDDVLIHFQLCFALVQLLLGYTGLDRIEVTHLVLCEVPLQLLVNGNSLEFDVVMPLSCFLNLMIIVLLHVVRFFLLLLDLPLQVLQNCLVVILFV